MRPTAAVAIVSCAVLACYVGPSVETFAPANGPQGIEAELRVRAAGKRGTVLGEVLEVQDTAVLVLRANRVVLVPLRVIQTGRFRDRGVLIENGGIARGALSRLRLVSRFPAGLTPTLRARLLAAYGQTEPEVAP
jgi:hypothetical protein